MRTHAILTAATLSLGLGAALASCQIFAGLTVLEITSGTGGHGGGGGAGGTSTTTTTTTTTTGTTGGGGAGGMGGSPECTQPANCGTDTTCQTFTCEDGKCGTSDAPFNTPCNDNSGQLCDGKGVCVGPGCMDMAKNGTETDVDCGGNCSKCDDGKVCKEDLDCTSTSYCAKSGGAAEGVCKKTKPKGDGCVNGNECDTGFCTEGVCCKTGPCVGECFSCAIAGNGVCSPKTGMSCGVSAATPCSQPDTCDNMGVCQPNNKPQGTSCGASATPCSLADTCDGSGNCQLNDKPANTPCGSSTDDQCTDPDTCDGSGTCLSNNVGNGSVCGGTCTGTTNYPAGSCAGGVCSAVGSQCPGSFSCKADHSGCNTQCNQNSDCADGLLCVPMMHVCVPCGTVPPGPYTCTPGSGGCETCDANDTCVATCDMAAECNANRSIGSVGMGSPSSRLECNGQCNGITVNCVGAAGCEVVCTGNGCAGLHLNCDANGPCKLTCKDNSCVNATVTCGSNTCQTMCDGPTPVTRTCGSSCSCTNNGC